ncbi:tryptophan 2,3-dioxygenase family protein [soil metagenome]
MTKMTSFGLPVPETGPRLTYGGYLKVRELLQLQSLRSDPPQHDETLFIIIHQTYELWFKQQLHELDNVIVRMDRDQPLSAQRLLQRCIEIQRVLVTQVGVLETMTPVDFLAFRDHLTPASGFQSSQFREIEFVAGLKEHRFLDYYEPGSPDRDALERRLETPSLQDAFYSLLGRRGFDLPADPGSAEDALESPEHRRRIAELVRLYLDADNHYDLFMLAEALIEFDESFRLWRLRHVAMVERMIGDKPGTGGSTGVHYLRKSAERKFFPDLWELRSDLGAEEATGPPEDHFSHETK